jgi:uncharacterized protein with HEPN domain
MTAIDDLTRLHHMQDAASEALGFMSGKTRDDLANNRMLVLAVVKDLEIIGEAAGRISADVGRDILGFLGQLWLGCEIG